MNHEGNRRIVTLFKIVAGIIAAVIVLIFAYLGLHRLYLSSITSGIYKGDLRVVGTEGTNSLGCYVRYTIADESVIKLKEEVKYGNSRGFKKGFIFEAVSSGETMLFFEDYTGGDDLRYSEVYKVRVDDDLEISYDVKTDLEKPFFATEKYVEYLSQEIENGISAYEVNEAGEETLISDAFTHYPFNGFSTLYGKVEVIDSLPENMSDLSRHFYIKCLKDIKNKEFFYIQIYVFKDKLIYGWSNKLEQAPDSWEVFTPDEWFSLDKLQ